MIFVTHRLPANEPGEPVLTGEALFNGLVRKANDALPFVPAMTRCIIVARHSDVCFDRDIEFRGQEFAERITLERPHRVVFTRLAGPVLGTIANEIEGSQGGQDSGDLTLRFSFALVVQGVAAGSPAEHDYAEGMTADYLQAVAATLDAVRRVARGEAA